jgi:hypothetical protein
VRRDIPYCALSRRGIRRCYTNALQRYPGAAQKGPLDPDMAAGSALPELLAFVPIITLRDFGVPRLPSLHPGRASYAEEAEC